MDIYEKKAALERYLKGLGGVAVAFSGGVDSTFLVSAAADALGGKLIAVTARSLSFPKREFDAAADFCRERGIRHMVVESEELEIEGFAKNPVNRCYICKSELFNKIIEAAREQGIEHVAEGSNTDDDGDYRPGLQAVKELGVHSPLRAVGLSKGEIRRLSKEMGLPTWNKQSFACLSSRFPYGHTITPQKLAMIDKAEQFLLDKGFWQVRVRVHDNLARLEVDADGFRLLEDAGLREEINNVFKGIGFDYTAADLLGYRTGSMNETLDIAEMK